MAVGTLRVSVCERERDRERERECDGDVSWKKNWREGER